MKKWYFLKYKGEEIFFQEEKNGKVIKFQRASAMKNRHSVIGITEISWISFYGRYLNWLSHRNEAVWVEITKEKFQAEVREYMSKILN